MSDADDTKRCGRCGTAFTASSPLGLCPSCLLKLGMSDPAITPVPAQEPQAEVVAAPTPPAAPVTTRLRLSSRRVSIAIAALVAIAAGALAVEFFRRPARESTAHISPVRFTLNLPDGTAMPDNAQFAVSGDGTQLVVAARRHDGGAQRLWLRRLQSLEWRELPQTDAATFPFWSPDGRHIGFFAGSRLKRIDIGNDLVDTICDVDSSRGGTWSSQGDILFAGRNGLFRVPASGGTPQAVTKLDPARRESAHLRPQFLPDGRHFLFLSQSLTDRSGATYIGSLETGEIRPIADGRGPAVFAGDQLLLSRGSSLSAQPFDYPNGHLIDEPRTIGGVEEIASDLRRASGFAASSTVLVYQRHEQRQRRLFWVDRKGYMARLEGEFTDADSFALSPDGRNVAVARRDGDGDMSSIWVMEVDARRVTRVTWGRARDDSPVWSPDGTRLAFTSRRNDNQGVHIVVRDLRGMEDSLLQVPDATLTDWSRDGRFLIYTARSATTRSDLWMLPMMGDKKPQPLDQTPADESQASMSPDGRLIAYVSDQSGKDEVYARSFPSPEGRWQISTGGGTHPRWSDDGRVLMYLSPEHQMISVDVTPAWPPQFGRPQQLFAVPEADDFAVRGQRFLVQMPVERGGDRQLDVILNWAAGLRR